MRSEFTYIQGWHQKLASMGWWHSFELPDGSTIDGVCPLDGLKHRLAQFPIPQDLRGKRVLDIGAWDGFFSFEMEKRGAEVVAIDCWDNPRLRLMRQILGSRVDYRIFDVYDLSPATVGRYDIVIFFGVLYHLKHPLLALERVCALSSDLVAVDSFVVKETQDLSTELARKPLMEFYETDEMGGMTDNWSGPNVSCLVSMCRAAGFARVEPLSLLEHSACVACYRTWEPPSDNFPAPRLIHALHNANSGINFSSVRDEYVTLRFTPPPMELSVRPSVTNVKPEVGPYGAYPMHVTAVEDGACQVNVKLPPGLERGWHDARVRVGESGRSNPLRIAVDLPVLIDAIDITSVQDGTTWAANEVDLARGRHLSIWVTSLPDNADVNNVRVTFRDLPLRVTYAKGTQINAEIPNDTAAGDGELRVTIGQAQSSPAALHVRFRESAVNP
jgi:tRNA (mo5U34)-methyltransferase